MNKYITAFSLTILLVFGVVKTASAHVSVKPDQVGVAERVNFVVSVPTEENVPTIHVRLIIPEGVKNVRPHVKPGWAIELMRSGEGDTARVSEILWSGGSIPAEQKDEFIFSAQVPAEKGTLRWKAYQTYENGQVVAWENSPEVVKEYEAKNYSIDGDDHSAAPKPYSETQVVNDLSESSSASATNESSSSNTLSVVAIAIAASALVMQLYKKK